MFLRGLGQRSFSTCLCLRKHIDRYKIGGREVVGHGISGQATYVDSVVFPYPAIRFREITPTFKAIREKEKGDWRSLTLEEKKTIYRISFRKTFAEMEAPSGQWKSIIGISLLLISAGVWLDMFLVARCNGPLPATFEPDRRKDQLKRMLAFRINPVEGISSKWDYEKGKWKD